ncbi:replication initiation protein [Psychrobacter sp. NPDC077938]|uniref:replication initiation protein n=1 Tax=Psychrobacter sp. NPDC077938 TaxID=3364494 RepID=UPI0037C533DA
MKETVLVQDNRITTARYELSLLEKRIMYLLLREVRNRFVVNKSGSTTLFNDLIVRTSSAALRKDLNETNTDKIKKALKSMRLRSFEWQNEYPEDHELHEWFEVGFINYGNWKRGGEIEFQVSHMILPFFVELTSRFTEYSSLVAMSLKSKWSQRFYEYCCQWRQAGGFNITITDLRSQLVLESKYVKYATLKKNVLEVAYKELKELYNKGQSDVYFEYSEFKKGRSVESLRFKVISKAKGTEHLSNDDIDYIVRTELHRIFDTKRKPKNNEFVGKTMTALRLDLDKMKHCYKRLETTVKKMPKEEQPKYLRYIINEDYLNENE